MRQTHERIWRKEIEPYRVKSGEWGSDSSCGNNGKFHIPNPHPQWTSDMFFTIICSDGDEWEHVSVSFNSRCPTWDEMCYVKHLFWSEEEAVMQLHPPESTYRNLHPYCLHLWRPVSMMIPLPNPDFVAPEPQKGARK